MKIGEIANAAGVTTSRIRFYERKGIIATADRGQNGYRDYPPELVELLRFIEQAQELGFSLKEIASIEVDLDDPDHIVSCDDALPMLAAKLQAVDDLIREAQARKRKIEAMMSQMRDGKRVAPSATN